MIGIPTTERAPVENLVIRIEDVGAAEQVAEMLAGSYDKFNWRTHFYLTGEGGAVEVEQAEIVIAAAADYLGRNGFVTFYFHPLLDISDDLQADIDRWQRLLELMRPFAEDAFEQQSEARLLVLPILIAGRGCTKKYWLPASEFFRSQFAKPSVIFSGADARERAGGAIVAAAGREIRFYINDSAANADATAVATDGYLDLLWRNLMFEQLLERIDDRDDRFTSPCAEHLFLDGADSAGDCLFKMVQEGESKPASQLLCRDSASDRPHDCTDCYDAAMLQMAEDLKVNDRTDEGRRAHNRLGLILSDTGKYSAAIEQLQLAERYSTDNAERTNCLIAEGMCRMKLGQLQEAEDALAQAAQLADDSGLVAYNRGLVQFEWHDYIEALDRFEEVLESDSDKVPRQDLYFYMAVCHINIEEYPEARPYLQRLAEEGGKPTVVSFYRGLCELGEGAAERALDYFVKSFELQPAEEDLGRVLFYQGHCLKELGEYERAVAPLVQAQNADPDDVAIPNLLGFCYYKLKQHEEAVGCFERVIELDPKSAIDYASLGSNLRELGRIEEAIAMYNKALELNPTIEFARQNVLLLSEKIKKG